jgi:hypothetical protein
MRPPRVRLRSLMILVAVVALALGAENTRRRWRSFRERAAYHAQEEQMSLQVADFQRIMILEFMQSTGNEAELRPTYDRQARLLAEAAEHVRKKQEYLSRWW